jgi:hypothetical protein
MTSQENRLERCRTLDEEIAAKIDADLRDGVLSKLPGFGKPLAVNTGYEQTPDEWRMPFKILKDAGYTPPEVEMMKARVSLQNERRDSKDPARCLDLERLIQELSLKIAHQMERLRSP